MAKVERVLPERAQELIGEGYLFLDVRTQQEFERGHVPGALNVPLMHRGDAGLVENPDFLPVVEAAFGKAERLIVGCQTGSRSLRAAKLLADAGFSSVRELMTGIDGSRDAFGRTLAGWIKRGLPIETEMAAGQSYADVRQRSPRSEP
jgi:rhodanese-related sulfurtransferase